MQKKAQAAIEMLIVAFIAIALLLLGVMLFIRYSNTSSQLTTEKNNQQECNKLADAISEIYASEATAQKGVYLSTTAQIQRTASNPGQTTVGQYYCNYFGNAKYGTTMDTAANGFSLSVGEYKISKDNANDLVLFETAT